MNKTELHDYLDFILPVIEEVSQYFLESRNADIQVENKSTVDLVTKYDKNIERILISRILAKFPEHKIIGEESSIDNPTLTNDPTWIIDPVDGTTNFARKLHLCGISVALAVNTHLVVGVIAVPYLGEVYSAIKGEGAFLNGERIKCSGVTEPKKAIFCYELGVAARSEEWHKIIMSRFSHYARDLHALRSLGCPVLSQCYVACGKMDAYQCDGLYPWDVAAGALIVREAGGWVTESTGKHFDFMKPNVLLASTKELSDSLVEMVQMADEKNNINI